MDIKVAPGTHATEAAGILSLLLPPTVSVWGSPLPSLLCCMCTNLLTANANVNKDFDYQTKLISMFSVHS